MTIQKDSNPHIDFLLQDIHVELERKIAEFHGHEAAILYASCFDANAGLFDALLTKDDVVLSDSLNHASIIDGIRMSKAQKLIYKHVDLSGMTHFNMERV